MTIKPRYGIWKVLCVKYTGPKPWAWLRSDCGHMGRVPLDKLDTFDATTPPGEAKA